MFFAAYGSDDEVKYLLTQGADIKDERYPPLNDAVKYGLVNAVEALLKGRCKSYAKRFILSNKCIRYYW